jgi:hypothetical protein
MSDGRASRSPRRAGVLALGAGLLVLATIGAAGAQAPSADAPVVVRLWVAPRLRAGEAAELRVEYRAPQANVVAVVQTLDDLDGPLESRASREREIGVIARAFGYEAGELRMPVAFVTPGRKRITVTLVTDEQERSDPAIVEVEVTP